MLACKAFFYFDFMTHSSVELFRNKEIAKSLENIHPVIIIAENIRTPENIGMIMRLAANVGAVLTLFAYDNEISFKGSKIKRTSSGAFDKIDWKVINTDEILNYLPKDYKVVALETTQYSKNIFDFIFPKKTAFVVGNEVIGICNSTLEIADETLYIPIPGNISSLNVTHALSIGLFSWFNQMTSVSKGS